MHIGTYGSAMFTDFAVACPATAPDFDALENGDFDDFKPFFATEINNTGTRAVGAYLRIANIREWPALGTPPNVVQVPVFGQRTSSSIQAQAEAPSLEFQINYVPSAFASGTLLEEMVGDGEYKLFRIAMLLTKPKGWASVDGPDQIGSVNNSQAFFIGKLENIVFTPSVSDTTTGTLTVTIAGEMKQMYTNAPTAP